MLPKIIQAKTYDLHRAHFIERIKLRYDIDLSESEYDVICQPAYIIKYFRGRFKKGRHCKVVGFIQIKSIEVIVLYNSATKSLDTCYPPDTLKNIDQLIRATIIGPMRGMAKTLYHQIIEVCEKEYRDDFESEHAAGKYFFTGGCKFPSLLIQKYKHGDWNLITVINMVARLLYCCHPIYKLNLEIMLRSVPEVQECDARKAEGSDTAGSQKPPGK